MLFAAGFLLSQPPFLFLRSRLRMQLHVDSEVDDITLNPLAMCMLGPSIVRAPAIVTLGNISASTSMTKAGGRSDDCGSPQL